MMGPVIQLLPPEILAILVNTSSFHTLAAAILWFCISAAIIMYAVLPNRKKCYFWIMSVTLIPTIILTVLSIIIFYLQSN
jgi:uncharacterized BrkB/YihY/UPF0761 family membrane protein